MILTEFGWPAGPDRRTETNQYTGQRCGVANQESQCQVIEETLTALDGLNLPGIVFEAFHETWKVRQEGPVGAFWGICEGTLTYTCRCLACRSFDGDEQVDVDDIRLIVAHWRQQRSDPGWDTRFDPVPGWKDRRRGHHAHCGAVGGHLSVARLPAMGDSDSA